MMKLCSILCVAVPILRNVKRNMTQLSAWFIGYCERTTKSIAVTNGKSRKCGRE